jgi:DNA-binding PadR family transcriptional regulator
MRISIPTKQVLQAFLDAPSQETYGYELAQATGLPSGTIYPILRRLEDEGLVSSRWEDVAQSDGATRRRRYYSLRGEGAQLARTVTQDQAVGLRALNPGWGAA